MFVKILFSRSSSVQSFSSIMPNWENECQDLKFWKCDETKETLSA